MPSILAVMHLSGEAFNSARIDLATACRVVTGLSEFAINIAPRVSAPSSSLVAVSGSSIWIVPPFAASVSECTITAWAYCSSSSVYRANPSTAGPSSTRIRCASGRRTPSRNASKPSASSSSPFFAPLAQPGRRPSTPCAPARRPPRKALSWLGSGDRGHRSSLVPHAPDPPPTSRGTRSRRTAAARRPPAQRGSARPALRAATTALMRRAWFSHSGVFGTSLPY